MIWLVALALASANVPTTVTLDEAIVEAVHLQPLLAVRKYTTSQWRARLQHERAVQYPTINFTAQLLEASNNASSADFLGVDDFPRVAGIATSQGIPTESRPAYAPRTNALVGFGAHYRLLDFGYTDERVEAARAQYGAAGDLEKQALQDVIYGVSQAYLHMVAAQQSVESAKEAQRRAQEHHALAAAGLAAGMRPAIDVTRSDAEGAAADLGVIRAQNALMIARSSLNTAIGWTPKPYAVAAPPGPAADAHTSDAVFDLAMQQRPDIAAYQAYIRSAQAQQKAAFALNFPQLGASASASVRGVNEWPRAVNWDVGLVLTLPIFTGFSIAAQVDEATAAVGRWGARLRVLKDAVAQQLEEARSTLVSATEAVHAATVQVTGASATLNQAEGRYKEGLGNIVELTDAQTQYDIAQQGLIQSHLAQALSAVQLKYVVAELTVPSQ